MVRISCRMIGKQTEERKAQDASLSRRQRQDWSPFVFGAMWTRKRSCGSFRAFAAPRRAAAGPAASRWMFPPVPTPSPRLSKGFWATVRERRRGVTASMSAPCVAVSENPDGAGYVSRAGREDVNLPDMKKPEAVPTAKPQTDPTRECVMKVELLAITPYPDRLIEDAGRTCYRSHSKARKGSEKQFVRKLIESGHHSVLEHAYATFRITGASRSFTHQLVRHRLCAFSQQSQRYVDERSFSYVEPPSIAAEPEAHGVFTRFMNDAKETYARLQALGIPNEDARFVLPNAVQSEIVISANFRELRHIFCLRCDRHAQWEIRYAALEMLRIMKKVAPAAFSDFVIDEETWTACTAFPS